MVVAKGFITPGNLHPFFHRRCCMGDLLLPVASRHRWKLIPPSLQEPQNMDVVALDKSFGSVVA
jgi:hypothetical protein